MNKLICLMGKSCTGKDTVFKRLLADERLDLEILIPYTTRPVRVNEKPGTEYHFVTEEEYEEYLKAGMILEERSYDTACGVWRYFTVNDPEIRASHRNYLYIGTLEAYVSLRKICGADRVIPVYIEVDDSIRIDRAVKREKKQPEPRFTEMCRRFIADTEDFSDEKLEEAGIVNRFNNENLEKCTEEIRTYILSRTGYTT